MTDISSAPERFDDHRLVESFRSFNVLPLTITLIRDPLSPRARGERVQGEGGEPTRLGY